MTQKKRVNKRNLPKATSKDDFKVIDFPVVEISIEKEEYHLEELLDRRIREGQLQIYGFVDIENPLFTNARRLNNATGKLYVMNSKKDIYLQVTPTNKPPKHKWETNKIPQEFDGKVFYAISEIIQEAKPENIIKGYTIMTYAMILKKAGFDRSKRPRLKDGVRRLRFTDYDFKNSFYNAELGEMAAEFNMHLIDVIVIMPKDLDKRSEEERKKISPHFASLKVKEILLVKKSDKLQNNIDFKGFLYFNRYELDRIKRSLQKRFYMMYMKWNGWENEAGIGEPNVLIRSFNFLASKGPLSWDPRNRYRTRKAIIEDNEELVKNGLIKAFIVLSQNDVKIVMFSEKERHEKLMKYLSELMSELETLSQKEDLPDSERFKLQEEKDALRKDIEQAERLNRKYASRDPYSPKLGVQKEVNIKSEDAHEQKNLIEEKQADVIDVEHEEVVSVAKPKVKEGTNQISLQIQQLIANIPAKHRSKGKLLKVVEKYFNIHGAEYIQKNINYAIQQEPKNFVAYLTDALAENYAKNTNKKEKVNPKVTEAKQIAKDCFNNSAIGCANGSWNSYSEVDGCFWCKKHQDKRLKKEKEQSVKVKSEPISNSAPEPQPQEQPLSEVEQLKLQMQQMMEQMQQVQQVQVQREQTLQQEIQQLRADKEKLAQDHNHPQPQTQTHNSSFGNLNFSQFKKPAQGQRPLSQGLTREQQQIVGKWFLLQDDLEKHPVLKRVYSSYIKNLQVDTEKSTMSKIVLFSDNKTVSAKLSSFDSNIIQIVQNVAGEDLEIVFETA